jgi:hypothetical protein
MFMVYFRVILGYIVSQEGNLLDLKKISTIVNIPQLKTPKDIKVSTEWLNFNGVSFETLHSSLHPSPNYYK